MAGFLTTVVKKKAEQGQGVIELLLCLPLFLGLTILISRINTAIQMSIVDQQYARMQALFITYHSPFYPELSKRNWLVTTGSNQLVLGVSDNTLSSDNAGSFYPKATEQLIARGRGVAGSNEPGMEPPLRGTVRIRNSVTLCTQNLVLGNQPILPLGSSSPYRAVGPFILNNNTKLDSFCKSGLKYEQ